MITILLSVANIMQDCVWSFSSVISSSCCHWALLWLVYSLSALLLNESMFQIVNYVYRNTQTKGFCLRLCIITVVMTHMDTSTRGSCVSLLLCAVSVWGWLVHGTSLKIDKEVRANESAWGSKKVWLRHGDRDKRVRKKESQCKSPHIHIMWEFEMEREMKNKYFR